MRLCMMYKIDRGLVVISEEGRLIPPKRSTSRTFQTITCRTEKRKMSFFPKKVSDWNVLPLTSRNWRHWKPSRLQCQYLAIRRAAIGDFKLYIMILLISESKQCCNGMTQLSWIHF